MTGHIPESFIEDILSKIDIVDVIKDYVVIKRNGANYVARCPFHNEKTPSFTISQPKQFYHCFGCGAHGNALRFLMEHSGLHFVEAIELLAARLGIEVPKEAQEIKAETSNTVVFEMLANASVYYQHQLRHHPLKRRAIDYLKARGLTGSTAQEFNLGFAPHAWEGLLQALGKSKEELKNLKAAGLIISKEKNHFYDRFRDRIMFPIRDRRGRVVGFGGRVIDEGEPKYLNSPETIVFNKSQEVYGLYEARAKNRKLESLIVVEGYLDVVMLAQFGVTNVVATLGTALTEKHLHLLFRQVDELIFCFDGDDAGQDAQKKALYLSLPEMKEGRKIKFMGLPIGEDPDSFIRKQGKVAFLNKCREAKSLSDFLFECASSHLDLNTIEGRSELVRIAKPLILKLPKGVFQQLMLERLEQFAKLPPGSLVKVQGNYRNSKYSRQYRHTPQPLPLPPAVRAAALLLEYRHLLKYTDELVDLTAIDVPGKSLLCAIIDILRKDLTMPVVSIEKLIPKEYRANLSLADLSSVARSVPHQGIEAEFKGALTRLAERSTEQTLEGLLKKAAHGTLSSEEKIELKALLGQKEKEGVA